MTADLDIRAAEPRQSRSKALRRGVWENAATAVIAAGVVMLMQPFSLTLYGWSFVTTSAGIVMFTIASKLPE